MTKKYTLKPGRHQFAPGSPASHTNDNLTDEEAEWYLEKYPHIAALFVEKFEGCKVETLTATESENIKDGVSENGESDTTTRLAESPEE